MKPTAREEIAAAQTLDQLQALAQRKGYSDGWVRRIIDAREAARRRDAKAVAEAKLAREYWQSQASTRDINWDLVK